jgi:plastocyanin
MRSLLPVAAGLLVLLAACDRASPVAPNRPLTARAEVQRNVSLMDACDPTTFNAAVGPGSCVRGGGMTFQQFLAELQAHGSVGAWHFAPTVVNASVGQTLLATNRGGEVHTFTEVEHFGGGIVPVLNQLSGNTTVAPECQHLEADDFVAPGHTYSEEIEEAGTENYQCCIHPWMRLTVNAR